jgi:hypothetical protein
VPSFVHDTLKALHHELCWHSVKIEFICFPILPVFWSVNRRLRKIALHSCELGGVMGLCVSDAFVGVLLHAEHMLVLLLVNLFLPIL